MSEGHSTADEIRGEEWAGEMGEKWLANLDRFESMIAPAGDALMARAAFRPGERVVEIGCGGGGTSIEIARAIGGGGHILAIDISPALIAHATERARAAGVTNARFVAADAATVAPGERFDRLFSRFGSMFFADFPAAFANLHSLLAAGGRMDLAVWAPPSENAWMLEMQRALAAQVDLPPPVPHAPGPFALGDEAFLRALLQGAGFGAIDLMLWRGDQRVGGAGASAAEAADFALTALSFAEPLKDKPGAAEAVRAELTDIFARYQTDDGVRMPAAAWLVKATA